MKHHINVPSDVESIVNQICGKKKKASTKKPTQSSHFLLCYLLIFVIQYTSFLNIQLQDSTESLDCIFVPFPSFSFSFSFIPPNSSSNGLAGSMCSMFYTLAN